jgi:ferrous iron transport protein B
LIEAVNTSLKVAITGNPNCGKTSVFNGLTGLNQQVGNYAGTTVDKKTGVLIYNKTQRANIIDLPGTYSIYPKSKDEEIAIEAIINPESKDAPDIILVVCDASNLKRNLLYFSQVTDLGKPVILVLTMMDLAEKKGLDINLILLSLNLGVKVVAVNPRNGRGIEKLKDTIFNTHRLTQNKLIDIYSLAPELIKEERALHPGYSDYHCFLHLYKTRRILLDEILSTETIQRYQAINEVLLDCVTQKTIEQEQFSNKLDKILTHRFWGYFIFLFILFLIFESIFSISKYPMLWIQESFTWFGTFFAEHFPEGPLNNLIVNGVIAGLSGVIVFLPQIILLFAFIAILEDSGYMARVSFMMDKLMRRVGMNGKSVVPLISGVACAVPSIMATRNIENWKERIITIMVIPLMSCSARLPVYTLLISLIAPDKNIWGVINVQGLILMGMYLLGFFSAIIAAWVMKFIIRSKERNFFILELPTYKAPRLKNILLTLIEKSRTFVWEAGKIIVAVSIILWMAASFGPGKSFAVIEAKYKSDIYTKNYNEKQIRNMEKSEKLFASYAGHFGRIIEPAIKPLGFDWKIGIALFSSLAAREVFVGTMATIYNLGDDDNKMNIKERMMEEKDPVTHQPKYTVTVAFSLMIFYAYALQCMSTIATTWKETKTWKWATIQFLYTCTMAYLASLLVYQLFK